MKHIFVINPAAGKTNVTEALLPRLHALFVGREEELETYLTTGVGDATRFVKERCAASCGEHLRFYSCGGDGTMNEVLQGLCRARAARPPGAAATALGVLPVGTMNVFALELGLPAADLAECWRRISSGRRREIDLWQANDQYFVQLAGVGFDAEIIQETPWERKKRFGPLSYVLSAAQVLTRPPPVLSVHIPGRPALIGSVVLVGGGRYYGGPVPVFPQASNQDGLLDLLVFRGLGGWELAQMIHAILVHGYQHAEDIDCLQVAEFTVTADREAPVEVDGELAPAVTPVHFRAAPFRLQVAG